MWTIKNVLYEYTIAVNLFVTTYFRYFHGCLKGNNILLNNVIIKVATVILYSRRSAEETIAPERTTRVRVYVGTTGRHDDTRASENRETPGHGTAYSDGAQ